LRENIFGGFGLNRRSRRIKERERGRRKEGRKEGRKEDDDAQRCKIYECNMLVDSQVGVGSENICLQGG
jgi:hypothetical protein